MKTNIICWFPTSSYTNDSIKQLLIENNIVPLLDSSYSKAIWEAEGKPETMRYYTFGAGTNQADYVDEPDTEKNLDAQGYLFLVATDKTVVGETCPELIYKLVREGCKNITLTSYGLHLFRIFGINIRLDCFSPVYTWNRIMKKYPDKFHFNWIMIDKPNRFKHLIEWCLRNGNTIGLVAPDRYKDNPEWAKEHLELFINAYKEVANVS